MPAGASIRTAAVCGGAPREGLAETPRCREGKRTVRLPNRPLVEAPRKRRIMEAGGIEPPSAVAPNRTSTSVVCDLVSPGGRCADNLPTGQPILWSHPSGDQRSFGASPFSDAATRTTGRIRSDASPNYLGGECEIVIRTYVDSRWFNEANRGPRLAARPENRPRRNLVAPVCSCGESVPGRRLMARDRVRHVRLLESDDLLLAEPELLCGQRVLEVLRLRGADDRCGHARLVQEPG
jgi:hypothetical protein